MRGRIAALLFAMLLLTGCAQEVPGPIEKSDESERTVVTDSSVEDATALSDESLDDAGVDSGTEGSNDLDEPTAEELYAAMDIVEDVRSEFIHGPKPAEYQRYIVLHDTEGDSGPEDTVSWWASNGNLVAAHFVVGKDGHIVQCVPLDCIAHHAGYGDTGHNELYGIEEDGRDDMLGTVPIGSRFADYGMNAWSVGIELVHVGGSGSYPEEQLAALDGLIAYIDAYFGSESQIIDHKAWRSGNSDTSPEFANYLANYQDHRTYR